MRACAAHALRSVYMDRHLTRWSRRVPGAEQAVKLRSSTAAQISAVDHRPGGQRHAATQCQSRDAPDAQQPEDHQEEAGPEGAGHDPQDRRLADRGAASSSLRQSNVTPVLLLAVFQTFVIPDTHRVIRPLHFHHTEAFAIKYNAVARNAGSKDGIGRIAGTLMSCGCDVRPRRKKRRRRRTKRRRTPRMQRLVRASAPL